jgi:hypothetical protein
MIATFPRPTIKLFVPLKVKGLGLLQVILRMSGESSATSPIGGAKLQSNLIVFFAMKSLLHGTDNPTKGKAEGQ